MALRVWLPLNGTLENKGISDYVIQSANITIVDNGKIGKCYSFNGSSSYISITNFNLSNNWSYGCWINTPNSDSRGWETAMILNNSGSDADSQFAFWVHQKENRFESLANTQYTSTIPYTNYYNSWHHFFATFNGSLLTTYIDGNVVNTKTITAEYYPATNLTIGARSKNAAGTAFTNWFQGYLNDVRVYDHCLSPKEVKEISQGLVLHYKLDGWSGGVNENLALDTANKINTSTAATKTVTLDYGLQSNFSLIRGKKITISADIILENAASTATSGSKRVGFEPAIRYSDNTFQYMGYWIGLDSTPKTSSGRYSTTVTVQDKDFQSIAQNGTYIQGLTSGTATIKNIKVELGDKATPWSPAPQDLGIDTTKVTDSSGYGTDGVITGTLTAESNSDRYNVSTYFNGSSYITISNPWKNGSIVTEFTHTAWIKWNSDCSTSSGIHSIAGGNSFFRFSLGKSNKLWAYGLRSSLNGETTSAAVLGQYGSTTSLVNGQWYFIAVTFKNGVCKCYCDGELVGTVDNSATYPALKSTIDNLYIGSHNGGGEYAIGNVADSRIYCTALSAEDILDLYHTSANVDNLGNLHGFEFVEDNERDSIYKNGIVSNGKNINYLINNFAETNTMTDWTFGGTSPSISNGVVTLTGTSPAVTSKTFTVNPDDIIVIEIGVQLTQTSTTFEPGIYLGTKFGQSTSLFSYNFTTNKWVVGSTNNTNPYFMTGYDSTDYYHCKTYLLGSNKTIDDIPDAKATNTITLYAIKLNSDTTTNIRSGYNQNTEMIIKLSDFKIYNLNQHGISQVDDSAKTGYGYIQYNDFIEK